MRNLPTQRLPSAAVLITLLVAGCSGGGGGGGVPGTGGNFVVLRTVPNNNGQLYLNESMALEFSNVVDPDSADFNAVSFAVFDLNGNQLAEPVEGSFVLGQATGDDEIGRRLEFQPRFPLNDTYDDGGFRPGRRYIVNLVRGDHRTNVGLVDVGGHGLAAAFSFSFQTADGTTPSQLFRDTKVGGPKKLAFDVSPRLATGEVDLNELGQVPVEIRLTFDQPLNPNSANVPFRIDLDPATRAVNRRGRIYLEYDDPSAKSTWIPAAVDLESNTLAGSVVVLRPFGVLPNNATVRVIVESTLEDMAGESNVNDPSHTRVFGEFDTGSSYELRFDGLAENFLDSANIDFTAPFVEPLAEVQPGSVLANFEFEGGRTTLDYEPNTQEVILNTDFTQVTPKNGRPINVSNGVFNFRDVLIPQGVTVRGTGSQPMVWLVTGNFTVAGDLLVEGGNGQRVDTLNAANFPSGGGVGNCGGGNGGQASQNTTDRTFVAESGWGPGQVPNGGGAGGKINCANSGCGSGSGGGGGSFATLGDPYYKTKASGHMVQQTGTGGYGCTSRTTTTLAGGKAGPLAFRDARLDNDYWGSAVDVYRGVRITGEMSKPLGGQGGGGGGDYALSCASNDAGFINDEKAGGGGAGGGVVIVKALGTIRITASGHISAKGGDGGGGAWAGASNLGGGGGGGSGGMVVLMAGETIEIETHGETYAANNYDFAVSADGGVGASEGAVASKYSASSIDARPTGGFGGLGIVQLMAPPGPNATDDKTNTLLDDNIIIKRGTAVLEGSEKQRYIGWRGFPDDKGVGRNDNGVAVNLGDNEGDIRPAPILMPAPFGTRSRIRSKWLDLGAVNRRTVASADGDGLPRGVVQQGSIPIGEEYGPLPEFFGVQTGAANQFTGYVDVKDDGVSINYPEVVNGLGVASGKGNVPYRGHAAYELNLAQVDAELAKQDHRYTNYRAVLKQGSVPLGEFRILGHVAGKTLWLSIGSANLADITGSTVTLAIQKKFFRVFTNEPPFEGLPEPFLGQAARKVPSGNIRIRFAFHQDPKSALISGNDPKRFPADTREYFADWTNPVALETIRKGHYRFVKYDILFNSQYYETVINPNSLSPDTPRPGINYLVLPYRY